MTALCPEAKQQNVSRISVIEGEVYTSRGERLRDDEGRTASFGHAFILARGRTQEEEKGNDISSTHVEDLPGVVPGEDDSEFDVDVQAHLVASDVQVPSQVFMRL